MRRFIFILLLTLAQSANVFALPQIDESSITDEKKFLVDNSQCIALARRGETGAGSDFVENAAKGAASGAVSSVTFGAMTGGVSGSGAGLGAVVGGLSGGSMSVYRNTQPNDQIYAKCMTDKGYKIWNRNQEE